MALPISPSPPRESACCWAVGTAPSAPPRPTPPANPTTLAVADFNGDGLPDIAVSDRDRGMVDVLLGRGDGTFAAAQSYVAGANPTGVAVGDFTGDGMPDIAVTNAI